MLKPPPLFRPLESLKVAATPRMLRAVLVVLLAVLLPTSVDKLLPRPAPLPPPPPAPLPVPSMDWTTDASRYTPPVLVLFGSVPAPVAQQKTAPCAEDVGEKELNGACWLAIKKTPPCPEGKAFEEKGACWMRVLHAAKLPTSGGGFPVNVAGEE